MAEKIRASWKWEHAIEDPLGYLEQSEKLYGSLPLASLEEGIIRLHEGLMSLEPEKIKSELEGRLLNYLVMQKLIYQLRYSMSTDPMEAKNNKSSLDRFNNIFEVSKDGLGLKQELYRYCLDCAERWTGDKYDRWQYFSQVIKDDLLLETGYGLR